MSSLVNYFKEKYAPLKGREWLKTLPKWEQKAFAQYGRSHAMHGVLGGTARAQTARRGPDGRFLPNES